MIDGRHDEAGIRQCCRGVVVLTEKSAPAVREDDKRKLCARDGTILDALQVIIGADRKAAKRNMRRLRSAGILDRA